MAQRRTVAAASAKACVIMCEDRVTCRTFQQPPESESTLASWPVELNSWLMNAKPPVSQSCRSTMGNDHCSAEDETDATRSMVSSLPVPLTHLASSPRPRFPPSRRSVTSSINRLITLDTLELLRFLFVVLLAFEAQGNSTSRRDYRNQPVATMFDPWKQTAVVPRDAC